MVPITHTHARIKSYNYIVMTKEGLHEYYCFGSWHQGGLGVGDLWRGGGNFAWDRLMCISIFHITQHHSTLATWTLIIILTIAPMQWAFRALLHGRPWNQATPFLWMQVLGVVVALGSPWDLLNTIHLHTPNAKNSSIVSSHGIWKEFVIEILGYNWKG